MAAGTSPSACSDLYCRWMFVKSAAVMARRLPFFLSSIAASGAKGKPRRVLQFGAAAAIIKGSRKRKRGMTGVGTWDQRACGAARHHREYGPGAGQRRTAGAGHPGGGGADRKSLLAVGGAGTGTGHRHGGHQPFAGAYG